MDSLPAPDLGQICMAGTVSPSNLCFVSLVPAVLRAIPDWVLPFDAITTTLPVLEVHGDREAGHQAQFYSLHQTPLLPGPGGLELLSCVGPPTLAGAGSFFFS